MPLHGRALPQRAHAAAIRGLSPCAAWPIREGVGSAPAYRDLGPVPLRVHASPPGPVPSPACAQEQTRPQPTPPAIPDPWEMVNANVIDSLIETWKTQAQFVEKTPVQRTISAIFALASRFCSDLGMIAIKSRSLFALSSLCFRSCFIRLVGRFA